MHMASDNGGIARMRAHNFSFPFGNLFQMVLFAGAIAAIGYFLYPQIEATFLANIWINGVIVVVLILGALYALKQVVDVFLAAGWMKRFLSASRFTDVGDPPAALSPMAELLSQQPGEIRLSALAARSMLDSVGARMSEAGEVTRYFARLLIFLGLLGTFWGLMSTLGGVVSIVNELAAATGGTGDVAVLFQRLKEPLEGMGIAFSSSILGIAGSLALGFLDLQAGQAQARFYNEVEDWLAKISRVGLTPGEGSPAYVNALLDQVAENMDAMQALAKRSETAREAEMKELRALVATIADAAKGRK
jgi:hypothetical protein